LRKLNLDWNIDSDDSQPSLRKYEKYLKNIGLRQSTIDSYICRVKNFLDFAETSRPPVEAFWDFRDHLIDQNLSQSSLNNYSFAVRHYYRMYGEDVSFKFVRPSNIIPYFFSEEEVAKIFDSIYNIKHLAMLQTLFYGCLRASELCNLDLTDVDLRHMRLRIREAKGGRDEFAYLSSRCVLPRYLEVRPPLEIDGRQPLFYTDFGLRWNRRVLYRMFVYYKQKAKVESPGGLHVFGRHTPASLLAARGCDIRIVSDLLRHRDIRTTLRYSHVDDTTKRQLYDKYLMI